MRRIMLVFAVLGLTALTASLTAAWATGEAVATRVSCPTKPATTFSRDDRHGLEFLGDDFAFDSFVDSSSHSVRLLGPGGQYAALGFDGWNENSFVNSGSGDRQTDILFDSGYPNAYAAGGHTDGSFPVVITIKRYKPNVTIDGAATWLLLYEPPSNVKLAFANGQALSSLRLCLDRGRNGTIDAALKPVGFVEGRLARDEDYPQVSGSVVDRRADSVTLAIKAADATSGVAGTWFYVEGTKQIGPYTRPLQVRSDAKVDVWAIDRAGNYAGPQIDVAKL